MVGAFDECGPPTTVPVTVHAGQSQRGFLLDVNDRGMFAALPNSLPAERVVEVEFEMPEGDQRLRVVGEVSGSSYYVGEDGVGFRGVSVAFYGIGDEGLDHLERFVGAGLGDPSWRLNGQRVSPV
jgi:hypothetical protein